MPDKSEYENFEKLASTVPKVPSRETQFRFDESLGKNRPGAQFPGSRSSESPPTSESSFCSFPFDERWSFRNNLGSVTQDIDYRACHELAKRDSREALKCYLGLALTKYGVGKDDPVRASNSLMDMAEGLEARCPDFRLSNELPDSVGVRKGFTFGSALQLFDSGENEKEPLRGYSLGRVLSHQFERLLDL